MSYDDIKPANGKNEFSEGEIPLRHRRHNLVECYREGVYNEFWSEIITSMDNESEPNGEKRYRRGTSFSHMIQRAMAMPPNPYAGGIPGRRTPDMPPNPYHSGMPGQRSPWGHSSPHHYAPRHNQPMQTTPTNHWNRSPQHPMRSRFTPPQFMPNYSPIPHHQSFQTPYSNKRGQDSRGRTSSLGGGFTPSGERKQGQKFHSRDRRSSGGGGGGRGGHRRGSDVPIEKYFREDMLKDPWADLEEKQEGYPTT